MNVFIIEDEPLGLDRLKRMIDSMDQQIVIKGHAETVKNAVWWLQNNEAPDLIFMDIELADGQCFEIFNQIEVPAPVVFTTSYDEYALSAFKVNSLDYLLKPIIKEELERSIQKYETLKNQLTKPWAIGNNIIDLIDHLKNHQPVRDFRKRFLVKQGQKLISIEVTDIAWFVADSKLCFLRTWDNQRYIIDYTLEQIIKMLDPSEFYRANRSYIIHSKSIKAINSYFGGKLILKLTPVTEQDDVIVSREKATEFKDWMGR